VLHSSVGLEKSEEALVAAAKAGDETAFRDLIEPLSRELSAYAYRMLGAFQDAEDALQETRLKAWRHLASYEPHAPFRAWVHRIATNTCLDMLRKEQRRVLPPDVGPPVQPGPPTTEMRDDISWLEPYPDALLPATTNPEATLRLHESVRLAFVRALQALPARQRAALILHDVLDWSVEDVASMLETTTAAINSALQRARGALQERGAPPDASPGERKERLDAQKAEALERFVKAWETGNFDEVVAMLRADAVMTMPPWIYWLDGRDALVATMIHPGTWEGELRSGRYRILPAPMNGQPGALAYVPRDGVWIPVCLTVMTLDEAGQIAAMDVFVLPKHFATWGFPATLEGPTTGVDMA
jgi:RNA polymerase sigma-70 factor (ECF subfamily)